MIFYINVKMQHYVVLRYHMMMMELVHVLLCLTESSSKLVEKVQ